MKTFLIVDGNWLSCRAAFVPSYLSNSEGKETGGIYRFITMLNSVMKKTKPTHILIAFDVKGDNFRKKINSNYKSNRNHENREDLYRQNDEIKRILSEVGIKYVGIPGYEADDIIGTYVKLSNANKTYVLSGDKDVFQLIDEKTTVIYPKNGIKDVDMVDLVFFEEKYGIKINQFIDFKCLLGDNSDNIHGLSGCGIKTASKLLREYGSVSEIINNSEKLSEKLKKNIKNWEKNVVDNKKIFSIVRNLDVPYSYDDCEISLSWEKAEYIFFELDFFSLIKKMKGGSFYNVKQ
jgi:DNA polymerase-1